MSTIKDKFSKLKTTVLGVKTADIDSTLDAASKSILSYKSQSGRNGYVDLVKSLIAKTGNFQFDASQNSFLGGSGLSPAMMGQGGRLHRYKTYETIVDYINYCYRALTVLVDNILSPDDITKVSLEVKPESYLEDEVGTESKQNVINEIIKKLKIEDNLELIVKSTLQYGDFFVEIADSKTALTSKSILAEQFRFGEESDTFTISENKQMAKVIIDYSSFNEAKSNDKKDQDDYLNNVHLLFHNPKYVVKLQSELFPLCFGYLVFPRVTVNQNLAMQDNMINSICQKLLKSLGDKVPQMKGFTNDKDLKEIISAMISETAEGKAINIRYIPPGKIQHFKRPTTKYNPYGESIFDSCQYIAKVLIALETALAIQRLARSTEKRKIGVEIGLPRDAKNAIEAMKEAFRKRKISLDSFGTVDTIPCLDLNTNINLTNGKSIPIGKLVEFFNQGEKFEVLSYNHKTGTICPDKVVSAKITGKNVEVIKVILDNNKEIICTPEHLFMLRDGSYKQAQFLEENDSLMHPNNNQKVNHKVKKVVKLKEKVDVADIQTENFHNFSIEDSIFVHNSMITTFEDIYIPMKDGKRFVEIEGFTEGNVDVRSKIDELKFMRDSTVASLGVPSSFLNIEENLCISLNSLIKLVDGREITLEQIIKEFEEGIINEVYSYDEKQGVIFSNKIKWAGKTKLQTKCVRVHLDNGEFVDCTPEHPFMLRDGTYKEAQYLEENESLMPLYQKNSYWRTSRGYYKEIYHPGINVWDIEYKSFYYYHYGKPEGYHIHHINGNPVDNRNCNLIALTPDEHMAIHSRTRFYNEEQLNELILNKNKFNKLKEPGLIITYEERYCDICGMQFIEKHSINRTTCSIKCRQERKRLDGIKSYEQRKNKNGNIMREDLTCFICGNPTKWTKVELTDKRYDQLKSQCLSCDDPKCKSRIRAVSNLTNKGSKLFCNIEYSKCEICGKSTILSNDKQRVLNVCSIRCMNTILSRRSAKKKKEQAAVKFKCEICGKEEEKPKWYVEKVSKKCVECREKTMYVKCEHINGSKKVIGLNHKVVRVEILEGLFDTGDITVEGDNHNFAVSAGIIVHNSNKSALSEENILFARTIVSHQKYLTQDVNELIKKVLEIVNPDEALTLFENVLISFPPPKSLQFEREARYMTELSNLIETLERIGIPREYSKKKYLTSIDWEEVDKYKIDQDLDKALGVEEEEPGMGEIGGMGGMGGTY